MDESMNHSDHLTAKAQAPLHAPTMQGFVWHLQTEEGDATTLKPLEDELITAKESPCN
jgi:hypothetical protein